MEGQVSVFFNWSVSINRDCQNLWLWFGYFQSSILHSPTTDPKFTIYYVVFPSPQCSKLKCCTQCIHFIFANSQLLQVMYPSHFSCPWSTYPTCLLEIALQKNVVQLVIDGCDQACVLLKWRFCSLGLETIQRFLIIRNGWKCMKWLEMHEIELLWLSGTSGKL